MKINPFYSILGILVSLVVLPARGGNGFVERIPAGTTQSVVADKNDVLVLKTASVEEEELTVIAALKNHLVTKYGNEGKKIGYTIDTKNRTISYSPGSNQSVTLSFQAVVSGKFP